MGKICGIYCIENTINHKKYIGQSIDIKRRWVDHRKYGQKETSDRSHFFIYQAINKYGIDNFRFYILEECSKDKLNEREIYWISYYNTYKNGYNMTIGGSGVVSDDPPCPRNKVPKNFYNFFNIDAPVKVAKLDKKYNVIKIYPSVQEASRCENVEATNISKTLTGKHTYCGDYIYMYYEDVHDLSKKDIIFNRVVSLYNESESMIVPDGHIGIIDEYDEDGNIINTFRSINLASKHYDLDPRTVKKVCIGKLKQTKNHIFQYNKQWYSDYLNVLDYIESENWWYEQYRKSGLEYNKWQDMPEFIKNKDIKNLYNLTLN